MKDKGTCFYLAELRVYSVFCDALSLRFGAIFNVSYPGEISTGSCLPRMGIDLDAPNRTFQASCRLFYDIAALWEIVTENVTGCMCLPGYIFTSYLTENQCQGERASIISYVVLYIYIYIYIYIYTHTYVDIYCNDQQQLFPCRCDYIATVAM